MVGTHEPSRAKRPSQDADNVVFVQLVRHYARSRRRNRRLQARAPAFRPEAAQVVAAAARIYFAAKWVVGAAARVHAESTRACFAASQVVITTIQSVIAMN